MFDKIVGGSQQARLVKPMLLGLGLLATWGRGNQKSGFVVRRPIPGFEKEYVVAIRRLLVVLV